MPTHESPEEYKHHEEKAKRFKVVVKVVSQKGDCIAGHRVGDEFTLGQMSPAGMCLPALAVVYPYFRVLELGGNFWQSSEPNLIRVPCPDVKNPAIFEVRRVQD